MQVRIPMGVFMTKRTCLSVIAAGGLLLPWLLAAQGSEEEGIRQLWNTQFLQKRPEGKSKKAAPKNLSYKPVGTAKASPKAASPGTSDTVLGVTLWRLRKPRPADDPNSRLLVLEDDASSPQGELVPERLEVETPLLRGDRVRLTVEAPRTGYLYVIDREQYADGTTSAAYLIYPNYQTRTGDNAVAAGRVIEIPDQRDTPNHFTVKPSRPDQVSEVLTMLITPEPLTGIDTTQRTVKISDQQFQEWEKQYGVQAERFELSGGAGETYSAAEKKAGAGGGSRLTQDDPMPQTLYRVTTAEGKAILLHVPVKIRK
jgi:hypothetical protein